MSLKEATDLAGKNGIKLEHSRMTDEQQLLFISKKYSTHLMKYTAEIHLLFTSESLELCRIYIIWSNHNQRKIIHQANLYLLFNELKAVFIKKYSIKEGSVHHGFYENTSLCNNIIRSGYIHKVTINTADDETIQLSHSRACNWVSIDYRDNSLYKSQYFETTDKHSELEKDSSKF